MLNDVVFVLGMGRSGTSALTRVLSLCGASLPQDLLPANLSNEAGHWEPLTALEINDRFLAAYGSNWYDPTLRVQLANAEHKDHRSAFIEEIVDFLDGCPKRPILVIKDPRITALADCWFEAVERLGGSVKIVIAVRSPISVAASLATRDGLSLELSSALWLKYNVLAVRVARGRRCVFVGYDNLISDWRHQFWKITTQIGLDLRSRSDDEIDTFLRSDLRHHISDSEPPEVFGGTWIGRLNSSLARAIQETVRPEREVEETYAALANGKINLERCVAEFEAFFAPRCGNQLID